MSAQSPSHPGPHAAIPVETARERFALQLFDQLWDRYRCRVSYVSDYERVVGDAGATFVNDHIALRTLACQEPLMGIPMVARIFEALGYRAAGCYHFPDKHLSAVHFQHAHSQFPKLFISELQVWQLPLDIRQILTRSVHRHRPPLDDELLATLAGIEHADESARAALLRTCVDWFHELPWQLPEKEDVLRVNEASQYAAWVLVHGYNINHFTSLVNSHGVDALDSIEKTVAALRAAGVPMKADIEGAAGSKLRQTATEAARIDVAVQQQGQPTTMPWTYAYFELAQRGTIVDTDSGKPVRFEGFLGPQATNLFEMTKL